MNRIVDAGLFSKSLADRIGLRTCSPPQLGQMLLKWLSEHSAQKVHSNEQILASLALGGRSLSQHSQFGLGISISHPFILKQAYAT